MDFDHTMPGAGLEAVQRAWRSQIQLGLARQGLGDLSAPMILYTLKHRGAQGEMETQRALADCLRLSPPTIAVSLRSLEKGGYLSRRADPHDGRRKRIALTRRGEEALICCEAVIRDVDRRAFSGFTPGEQAEMTEFFRRMLCNLREEPPSGDDKRRKESCSGA